MASSTGRLIGHHDGTPDGIRAKDTHKKMLATPVATTQQRIRTGNTRRPNAVHIVVAITIARLNPVTKQAQSSQDGIDVGVTCRVTPKNTAIAANQTTISHK